MFSNMSLTTTSKVLTIVLIIWLLTLGRSLLIMIGGSRIIKKASKNEKTAMYPIINLFTMLEVVDISTFFGILLFVPGINVIILLWMSYKLGFVFNTGIGYRIGLMILPIVFYPALAFSNKSYKLTDEEYFKALDNTGSKITSLETEETIDIPEPTDNLEQFEEKEEAIDSVFKSNFEQAEKAAPYKAVKIDLLGMEKLKENDGIDDVFKPEENEHVKKESVEPQKNEEKKKEFEMVDL